MRDSSAALLATTCVFAAGAVAGASLAYALASRRAPFLAAAASPREPSASFSLDDEVLGEALARNVQFFGREGQQRVCDAFVVVVGLGGVGSHAAHMLLRSGVGRLRLVDFDQVTLSSLNRHAVATRADVGTPKALALARHFRDICPETEVEARVAMYEESAEEELLGGNPSCVLDCIDNIDTKVALLAACHRRGIPVLCCAGAGAKADPTRLHIASLSDSVRDPLARAVRHRLRRLHGREVDVPVLFSSEAPRCGLVASEAGVDPAELQLLPGFRVRTIPVLGTTPAVFGCAAAAWALCSLAGTPVHGAPPIHAPPEAVAVQLDRLCEREHLRFGSDEGVQVDAQDVHYVMSELWSCRSARHGLGEAAVPSNSRKAVFRSTAQLVLTRWDAAKPAAVDNLVLLTFDEAEAHDEAESLDAVRAAQPAWAERVEAALRRASREHGHCA